MSGVNKTYKVGPLEDSTGNIISQGFLMAEDLNGYFSSVFTKEDISSLPVADAKFQGAKSDYLGPSQRPRWQVDKEAIGLSRVQQCSSTYSPPY